MTDRAHGRPCNKNRRMTRQTGEVSETTVGSIDGSSNKGEAIYSNRSTPLTQIGGRQRWHIELASMF
jgi:hypothetical protein